MDVETTASAPDVEVDLTRIAVRGGHDRNWKKQVQIVMDELKKNPLPTAQEPAYPKYHRGGQRAVENQKRVRNP